MKSLFNYIFLLIIFASQTFAQYEENYFAISTNFSFNTTAKIFLNPDGGVISSQTEYFELEDIVCRQDLKSYRFRIAMKMLHYDQTQK